MYKVGNKCPPKETRFPVNRPYAPNAGHKGPYLLPLLKKFLNKKINYIDPETDKKIKGRVKDAVLWRLILNATQGETHAIVHILDRIDGKVADVIKEVKDDSALINDEIELISNDGNGKMNRIRNYLKKQE